MSDLPEGWEWTTLGELGTWRGGGTPSKSTSYYWKNGTIPWVSPKDMGSGTIASAVDSITQQAIAETNIKTVPSGSVLMVVRSGILVRRFPVAVSEIDVALNQDMKALMPAPGVDVSWLAFVLRALEEDILAHCRKDGTTVASVNSTSLANLAVPLPPLAEQRRIVAALEDHLSRLDGGLSAVSAAQQRIRVLTKRVLVSAIPDPLPADWRVATVGDVGSVELGRQRHPEWHYGEHMRPYLRVANVFEDRIDTGDVMEMDFPPEVFERFRLEFGDILLNEGQSPELLGRPAMYRGEPESVAFTNSLLRFKSGQGVDPEWALLVFRRHMHARRYLRDMRITTNIAHISAGRFKRIEFPLPPLARQAQIVRDVGNQLAKIDRLADVVQQSASRSERLRRSLLREAFAGRLVGQDPEDEPASVLLERIRAERESAPKVKRGRKPRGVKAAAKAASTDEVPSIDPARPAPPPIGKGTQDALDLGL